MLAQTGIVHTPRIFSSPLTRRLRRWAAARGSQPQLPRLNDKHRIAAQELRDHRSGICGGDDRKIDTAATNFSTPYDMRVRDAVRAAFDKGGIGREDFPGSIRLWLTMLAGDPVSACATGRRADSQR